MEPANNVNDANGSSVKRGDLVTTLSDHTTAKVVEVATDLDIGFVRLKPVSYSVGKGVWHASDHVLLLRACKVTAPSKTTGKTASPTSPAPPKSSPPKRASKSSNASPK